MTISDFNSILEVSIALHLAYAFIRDIHEYHLTKIEEVLDRASAAAKDNLHGADTSHLNFQIRRLRFSVSERRREIEAPTLLKQKICVAIAIVSTALLIVSGFNPDRELGVIVCVFLLCITLLPMPCCCLLSFLSHGRWRKGLEDRISDLFAAWGLALGISENVYKPKRG